MPELYTEFAHVPLDKILVDDSRNTRVSSGLDEDEIEAFAQRFAAEGQIQPVGIRPPNDKGECELVLGYRRIKAARLLGWPTIWAGFLRPEISNEQAELIHQLENIDRANLNTYELAMGARKVTENKTGSPMSLFDYSQRVGVPYKTIQAFVEYTKGLPEEVMKDWRAGHHLLTPKNLQRLYGMRMDDAAKAWAEWRAWSDGGKQGQRPNDMPKNPYRRPTPKRLIKLHESAAEADIPKSVPGHVVRQLIIDTIEYAQGARKDPPKFVIASSSPKKSKKSKPPAKTPKGKTK